jgi:hypothetical protein
MANFNLISSKYGDFCVISPAKKNPFVQLALGIFCRQSAKIFPPTPPPPPKKKKKTAA